MRQETLLFIDDVIRKDRSILDFIDGRFTYVNGPLARFYGIPGIDGEAFTRVELDGEQRSGIVTQGAVLSISSYANRTSPVIRGKWVLENLLGAAPPPPPDNIPPLEEHDLGEAAYFANTIVLMREGRIAQQGTYADMRRAPADAFVRAFLAAQQPLAPRRD